MIFSIQKQFGTFLVGLQRVLRVFLGVRRCTHQVHADRCVRKFAGATASFTPHLAREGGHVEDARLRTVMLLVWRDKEAELRGAVPAWSRESESRVGWEDDRGHSEHMGLKGGRWRPMWGIVQRLRNEISRCCPRNPKESYRAEKTVSQR